MAVVSISKIQVRRGLQENLPQLAGGEMGWSVDERRLWIGNGTLSEGAPEVGNTEILTVKSNIMDSIESYIFKGTESGYTSITGPTALFPTKRTLQEKLDDVVNFRDFITDADISSGNYTTALQRAIDQIFWSGSETNPKLRRVLRIPAGRWEISNITIPSYATLQGDGRSSTFLVGNFSLSPNVSVVQFSNSAGRTGSLASSATIGNITLTGMSLISTTQANVVTIDGARDVKFYDVAFIGANTAPVNFNRITYAVGIGSTVSPARDITFDRCLFQNAHFGLIASGDVNHVTVNDSKFETATVGLYAQNLPGPQIKVTNSYFNNIAQSAIGSVDESSIVSAFNIFDICGNGNNLVMNSGVPNYAVIFWDASSNYSVSDVFSRSQVEEIVKPIYETVNPGINSKRSYSATGTLRSTPGFSSDVIDGGVQASEVVLYPGQSAIVDYRIYRTSSNRILYSEEFNNSAWVKLRSNVSANVSSSPFGGALTADKLVENTQANVSHLAYQDSNVTPGSTNTFSVYARAVERGNVQISISNLLSPFEEFRVGVNLATGANTGNVIVTNTSANSSFTVSNVGSGWFRVSVTGSFLANSFIPGTNITPIRSTVFLATGIGANAAGNITYTGDGTSGILLWGAQFESRATPSTYIQTTDGSPVQSRIGSTRITNAGGQVFFEDDYTESSDVGISLAFSTLGSGNLTTVMNFDSVATGRPGYVSYNSRSFF